jgi:hypothetical protein
MISIDLDENGEVSVGDELEYHVTATNDGPTQLSNVIVSDDLTGASKTCPVIMWPGDTCVLITHYVVTTDDLLSGTIVNVGRAVSDQTDSVVTASEQITDQVDVEVPTTDLGQLSPTGTTCDDYLVSSMDFRDFYGVIQYSVKSGNKIFQVNPGVFFYYTGLSETITKGTVIIKQSIMENNNPGIGPIAPVNQDIKLWLVTDGTCTKTSRNSFGHSIDGGEVTINITEPAPDDSYYVISVKYDTGSLKGKVATGSSTYMFSTDIGNSGHFQETDRYGITLSPKDQRKLRGRS